MVGPSHVAEAAAIGGVLATAIVCLLVLVERVQSFNRRFGYKDHVPTRRRVRLYPQDCGKYVYHETDWQQFGKVLVSAFGIGAVVASAAVIFGVGLIEVLG